MFHGRVTLAACVAGRSAVNGQPVQAVQTFATVSPVSIAARNHKVIVVGGGSAGLSISHQLLRSGKFTQDDIAIIDPSTWHHYQPGWTLVGGGLKTKEELRRPLRDLIASKLKLYNDSVCTFSPEDNLITLGNGDKVSYEQLVVVPGINIEYDKIKGLPEALAAPDSLVSSIYGYDTCDKVFRTIQKLRKGVAIFTQPTGVVKCAGAPQKIKWLALDHWKRAGLYDPSNPSSSAIKISFATGLPTMFGVPKYSAKLEEMRKERGVEGLFQHDLIAIDGNTATFARPYVKEQVKKQFDLCIGNTANFARPDGKEQAKKQFDLCIGNTATFAHPDGKELVKKQFDLLHVVPKMGPHAFVKNSALANEAGFVDVDEATTRHKKYPNVWSAGDASSLPTSKTVAAITSQAPVLVHNLLQSMEGKEPEMTYDGYTSCPLLTEYGKVLLAEFKYGGEPNETFGKWLGIDQGTPRRAFYYLKKDFFPWVYYKSMVKGTWGGAKGWIK
jgi:NADPH-dependent 2,4-dienoyl-CoA reductase/sulfur reductase-like enzyme